MSDLPENIVIREFAAADRPLVEAFFKQMGGETRALFDRNSYNYNVAMRYFDGAGANIVYYLAELDGVMIGYVYLSDIDKGVIWLGIAVHEDFKGKHLGRRLIQRATDYARENKKGGILLTTHVVNMRGQGLYDRMGFERIGMSNSGEVLYIWRTKD